jgi:hypothetical protein
MIPDAIFKTLDHTYAGYNHFLNGQTLEKGYKPDFVLKKDNAYIILESENSSSRKTFVGGLIKAAHFLQKDRTGQLIFVIVPKRNTSASSIAKHLKPYLEWVADKTNLRDVFIVEGQNYFSNNIVLPLDCEHFSKCAFKV